MKSGLKIFKEPIILRIYLLLATFFIAVFLIWTVDIIFSNENERIKNELLNFQQKLQLGNLLQKELYQINNEFIVLPAISHPKQLENSISLITNLIKSAHEVVNTLEKGGTIYETVQSNFYETDEFVNKISYVAQDSSEFVIEVINIRPKLNDLLKHAMEIDTLVTNKLNATSPIEIENLESKISFEIKKVETILTRTHENGNRIYFDVSNKIQQLEGLYNSKLRQWHFIEAMIILLISLIELAIIIYLISQTTRVIQSQRLADEENRQLLNAVENSPVAITITDAGGIIEYVNKQFTDLTGFEKTEVIGSNASIIKHESEQTESFSSIWKIVSSGKTWKGEMINKKKDGTEYFSRSVISPIFDLSGKITNFISIQEDLTEKKKLTSSLNQSYDTLKEIFDKIPVGVVLLKGKTIFQINAAAAEIMGYNSVDEAHKTLNGKNCHGNYCSVPDGECPIFDLKGKFFSLQEKSMIGKGGRKLSILKSVIPVKIHDEEYLLEAFMDIEAQQKAREREKEANRAKSEFLANMSHEIRTPMNGIIGAIEILKNAQLDDDHKMLLQIIQQSSEILLNIINDILDFSKIEAGKFKIESYSFNLFDAVEAIVDQFALRAKSKNLHLFHYIDTRLPRFIIGDEIRLMQILINLVGNAIKFTGDGHVFIQVSKLDADLENKVRISFSIEDTGIGIQPDRINKIFDAFTQADGSTNRKFGGTGLGTTISKMLVDLMGGNISAQSPNPKLEAGSGNPGSVFKVVLDFEIDEKSGNLEAEPLQFEDMDAFVLTNNDTTRYIKNEILKNLDISAEFFSRPLEALAFFKNKGNIHKKNNLLIIDYDAPEGTCFEFLDDISTLGNLEQIKIVLVTSHSIPAERQEFAYKYIDAVLIKPVRQSKLKQTIIKIFSDKQPEAANSDLVDSAKVTAFPDLKILLAEDNLINQSIAKQSFLKLNLKIDIVENGLKAIEALKSKTYDFIFMDVMMPEMNGLDATMEIRKFNTRVKIFAMTANAMKGDRETCLDAGMNDYISKPFKIKDLEALLSKWVFEV